MFSIQFTKAFERDMKHYVRKGGTRADLERILDVLQAGHSLPLGLKDHQLQGKMRDFRELHVQHDWLLVYRKNGKELIITCIWLVSHQKLQQRERTM